MQGLGVGVCRGHFSLAEVCRGHSWLYIMNTTNTNPRGVPIHSRRRQRVFDHDFCRAIRALFGCTVGARASPSCTKDLPERAQTRARTS